MDPAEPADPTNHPAAGPGGPGSNGNGRWHGGNGDGVVDTTHDAAAADHSDYPAGPPEYTCPACSVTFAVPDEPADRVLECPACHTQFFLPADDDWRDDRDEADEPEERDFAAEFNQKHIKKVTEYRRGLYRTRNYVLVGVFAQAAVAFALVFRAAGHLVFGTFGLRATAYVVVAALCVVGAVRLRRRTWDIDRELDETALPEPDTEPDFSTLSDGTGFLDQIERNLERLGRRRDDDPPPADGAEGRTEDGTAHE